MRPTEVPASAKRLKQLALLESVADESARMLSGRPPVTHPAPLNTGPHYPLPPASVPPPPIFPHDGMHVIYSSGPSAGQPHAVPVHSDPFQVRPWTSQAFHRGPVHPHAPSMSMTQGQLLGLMNGPRGTPMPGLHGFVPPPLAPMGQYRPYLPAAPMMSAPYGGPLPRLPRQTFGPAQVSPLSAPAMSPGFNLGGGAPNPALLSILNEGGGGVDSVVT
ncbi:hypothetical protein B0H10DRAFT_400900 [Mycena sp. CBHHK59/15]|nr:hypothetical protein B0H10DRAFT_400900 [Mycena sp. CBHHK59/15]